MRMTVGEPGDGPPNASPPRHRFLHVAVENKKRRWPASWVTQPETAISCYAFLSILEPQEKKSVLQAIPGRWSGTPELLLPAVVEHQGVPKVVHIYDNTKLPLGRKIDIPPGQVEPLVVALKSDWETMCYVFSNESYAYGWKKPEWALDRREYLVKVTVTSGTVEQHAMFMLENPSKSISDFVLKPLSKRSQS